VNVFWTEPAKAFAAAAELLRPKGTLVLVYEPPTAAGTERLRAKVRDASAGAGWHLVGRPARKRSCIAFEARRRTRHRAGLEQAPPGRVGRFTPCSCSVPSPADSSRGALAISSPRSSYASQVISSGRR
jgi:hypothetical protein